MNKDLLLVTGSAQVPKGITLYEEKKIVGVVFVINLKTEIIEQAEFTLTTNLSNEFLSNLVTGYNLKEGEDPLLNLIKRHCIIPSQGAIIQAIRSAYERYREYRR